MARRSKKNPKNYMIPLDFPEQDYMYGAQPKMAHWTSFPDYSYNVFWREKWGLPVWQASGAGAAWGPAASEAKNNPAAAGYSVTVFGEVVSTHATRAEAKAARAKWLKSQTRVPAYGVKVKVSSPRTLDNPSPAQVTAWVVSPKGTIVARRPMTEAEAREFLMASWKALDRRGEETNDWSLGFERANGTGEMLWADLVPKVFRGRTVPGQSVLKLGWSAIGGPGSYAQSNPRYWAQEPGMQTGFMVSADSAPEALMKARRKTGRNRGKFQISPVGQSNPNAAKAPASDPGPGPYHPGKWYVETKMPTNAGMALTAHESNWGPYLPNMFPYGQGGRKATYKNPRTESPTVSWQHELEKLQRLALGAVAQSNPYYSDDDERSRDFGKMSGIAYEMKHGTSDPALIRFVPWVKSKIEDFRQRGLPGAVRQMEHSLALAEKELARRVKLKGSKIRKSRGKSGYAMKPTKKVLAARRKKKAARKPRTLPAWQQQARELGIKFVGRLKADVLADIEALTGSAVANPEGRKKWEVWGELRVEALATPHGEPTSIKIKAFSPAEAWAKAGRLSQKALHEEFGPRFPAVAGMKLIFRPLARHEAVEGWNPPAQSRHNPRYRQGQHGSGPRGGYTKSERASLPSSVFLKPETRTWPVSDRRHAEIALQYMTAGRGRPQEYPTLIKRLARHWPVIPANRDIWQTYSRYRSDIAAKAGKRMPTLKQLAGGSERSRRAIANGLAVFSNPADISKAEYLSLRSTPLGTRDPRVHRVFSMGTRALQAAAARGDVVAGWEIEYRMGKPGRSAFGIGARANR